MDTKFVDAKGSQHNIRGKCQKIVRDIEQKIPWSPASSVGRTLDFSSNGQGFESLVGRSIKWIQILLMQTVFSTQ